MPNPDYEKDCMGPNQSRSGPLSNLLKQIRQPSPIERPSFLSAAPSELVGREYPDELFREEEE